MVHGYQRTTSEGCWRSFANSMANGECFGFVQNDNDDDKADIVQKMAQKAIKESAQTKVKKPAARSLPTVITIPGEGRKHISYDCLIL